MGGKAQYKTRQYNLILDYLKTNASRYATVPEMSLCFKRAGTPVGAATIYRQLEKLCEAGQAHKFSRPGVRGSCYQYHSITSNCNRHFHLKCEQCNKLIHLNAAETGTLRHHVLANHGFVPNCTKTIIYGVCSHCMRLKPQEI